MKTELEKESICKGFSGTESILDVTMTGSFRYSEYWKRARRKLRINEIMHRHDNLGEASPFLVSRTILNAYLDTFGEIESEEKTWIFVPYGKFYLFWVLVIVGVLAYFTTYGIYHTAFVGDISGSLHAKLEVLFEVLLVLDIFLSFNLATYNEDNHFVKDRVMIAKHYIKGRLFIDILAAFPFGIYSLTDQGLLNHNILIFRHIFRMIKWTGYSKRLQNYTFVKKIDIWLVLYKHIWGFFGILIRILLFLHICTCFCFLLGRYNDFDISTWVYRSSIQDETPVEQYFAAAYYTLTTILTIGYGEIHPYSKKEIIFAMSLMISSMYFISITVCQFYLILKYIFSRDHIIALDFLMSDEIFRDHKISPSLLALLRRTISKQFIKIHNFNIKKVLKSLEFSLLYEIALNIFNHAILRIPFFSMKSKDFIVDFTFRLDFVQYSGDSYLWKNGFYCDGIYFLVSGIVSLFYGKIGFFYYHEGGFLGDMEVFYKMERKFDAKMTVPCRFLKMSQANLEYLKEHYPIYHKELKTMVKIRLKNLILGLAQMVAIYDYRKGVIDSISKYTIKEIRDRFIKEIFKADFNFNQKRMIEDCLSNLKVTENYIERINKLLLTIDY